MFVIHAYAKQELAMLYFPTATPHTAVNHLTSWINRCTPLRAALQDIGYRKTAKYYTSREVEQIVYFLGEP